MECFYQYKITVIQTKRQLNIVDISTKELRQIKKSLFTLHLFVFMIFDSISVLV